MTRKNGKNSRSILEINKIVFYCKNELGKKRTEKMEANRNNVINDCLRQNILINNYYTTKN